MHQSSMSALTELLTTEQVAELLQVPVASVIGWRERRRGGIGPRFIRVGRFVRYRREDVLAFVGHQGLSRLSASIVRLVSPEQVAELLNVSTKTLAAWRAERIGPPFVKLSADCVRYKLTDVEAWIGKKEVVR